MKRILSYAVLIGAFLVSGCMTGTTRTDFQTVKEADLVFLGLPAPLSWITFGIQGTVFQVTTEAALTANHVATYTAKTKLARYGGCDIALIKRSGDVPRKLAYARFGETVTIYGYSGFNSLPKSGTGRIMGQVKQYGCTVMVVKGGGGIAGMSGGPVINSSGEIVGVFIGGWPGTGNVAFVPVQSFSPMLDQQGIPYKRYSDREVTQWLWSTEGRAEFIKEQAMRSKK